jgi:hypothetical protein
MTNVLRCYRQHKTQLENDAPHRVVRRLAQDLHAFLNRDDVKGKHLAQTIDRYLGELHTNTYEECTPPRPAREEGDEADDEAVIDEDDEEDDEEGG